MNQISDVIEQLFSEAHDAFKTQSFEKIESVLKSKSEIYSILKSNIEIQVKRTRTEESSPKNTTLYFTLLLETKDLMNAAMNLLEEYHTQHDSSIEPAKIVDDKQ